uniref:uncharacterized protein isoform X2 n=1 Tax=Myxine glutinosa TaxID=7769 RepID=UPI00358FF375
MLLPKLAAIYLSLTLSGVRALQCSPEHGSDFTFVDAGGGQAFVKSIGVRTSIPTLEPLLPEKKITSVSVDGDLLWLVTVEGTIMLCNV